MVVSCHRQHRCCSRQDKGSGISVQAYGSAAPRSTRNNGDAGETLVDQQTGKGKEMRLEENSPAEAEAERGRAQLARVGVMARPHDL